MWGLACFVIRKGCASRLKVVKGQCGLTNTLRGASGHDKTLSQSCNTNWTVMTKNKSFPESFY